MAAAGAAPALLCVAVPARAAQDASDQPAETPAKKWSRDYGRASAMIREEAGAPGLAAARRLIVFARSSFGPNDRRTLQSMELEGQALYKMGRYIESEKIWAALLPRYEAEFGAGGTATLVLLANLANLYRSLGRYPEAAAMGERAVAVLTATFGADDADTLSSRNNLANTYADMGAYQKALGEHRAILASRERVLGPDHRNTLSSMHNLGSVYDELGDIDNAERFIRGAYEARVRVFGPADRDTLSSASYLASIMRQRGDEAGARKYYQSAYDGNLALLGPDHPSTLSALDAVADVLEDDGRYAEAEPIYIKLLADRERTLARDHPDTIGSVLSLAAHYKATSRFDLAGPLYERAVETRRRILGAEHPYTLNALTNLAWFRYDRGETQVASEMLEALYRDRLRILGPEHPDTISATVSLGNLYVGLDRFDDAEAQLRKALELDRRLFGADSPPALAVQSDLASLMTDRSRYAEAEAMLRPVRDAYAARYGAAHPDTLQVDVQLAVNAFYQGRLGEAETGYRAVLAQTESIFGADHPRTLTAYNNLGVLYDEQGRFEAAEALQKRAYDGTVKLYGAGDQETMDQRLTLGDHYRGRKRFAEAEAAYRETYTAAAAKFGADSSITLRAANQLGHVFRESGRPAEAESWYRIALAGRTKVFGAEHRSTLYTKNKLAVVLRDQGKYAEAEALFSEVLAAQLRSLRPGHIDFADSFSDFGGLLAARGGDRAKAIFFYKQAVNVLQSMREEMRGAGGKDNSDTQTSFVALWEPTYSALQALLVGEGRFAEAEQVGRMLKETEYVSIVRGDARPVSDGLTLTRREDAWAAQLADWAGRPNRLANALDTLAAKKAAEGSLTAFEERQLGELQTAHDTAYADYQKTINGWLGEVRNLDDEQLQEEARELEVKFSDRRRAEIGAIGPDVALLQIVAFEDSIEFFLITPKAMKHVSAPVSRKALFAAIYESRAVLKDGYSWGETESADHQRQVRARLGLLYDMLIRPVAGELADAGTKTLMLNLQGKIRYAPFAALFDGDQWLVENYRLALYTPAANTIYSTPASMKGGSGLGLSKKVPGFSALPAVPRELEAILTGSDSTGTLQGDIALDDAFTRAALEGALARREPVLHLASHFKMEPGDESSSFLVLGDGSKLTLAEIGQSSRMSFNGIELVTLSACETGLGGEGTGMEIDGLGALAQNKGAGSVIATLWNVVDDSTATLMTDFYRGVADNGMTKAEALRQAQLKLLRTPETADPYYWAPFVLMGNWK